MSIQEEFVGCLEPRIPLLGGRLGSSFSFILLRRWWNSFKFIDNIVAYALLYHITQETSCREMKELTVYCCPDTSGTGCSNVSSRLSISAGFLECYQLCAV